MLRSPILLLFVATVILALLGSACAPQAVMKPRVARVSLTNQPSGTMEQSCAGELCFPYEVERER